MTSNASAIPSREASSASPDDRRTTSSTFSFSKNRSSYASSETGESSRAASKKDSLLNDGVENEGSNRDLKTDLAGKDGRGSFRSHRSRTSGGFLLSNTTFEPPSRDITPPTTNGPTSPRGIDSKGKAVLRSPEKRQKKRKSNLGLGLGGSPLAGNVTNAPREDGAISPEGKATNENTLEDGNTTASVLDVDSAQIVNLALNLSESRRNASRRMVSSPLPPPVATFGENIAGSSMRYHIQQQRRSSRNVSPKPDRGEKIPTTVSRVPSGQRISRPMLSAFDLQQEGAYQYHFSASTLARAEKAKKALELMAQYRELLHFLPPLKPQKLERTTTAGTLVSVPGSPTSSLPPLRPGSTNTQPKLGRQYNPLQYIRNRKVRARNSKAIDGEAQGFANLDKVTTWVHEVSKEASSPDYQAADCLPLPPFNLDETSVGQQTSPPSTLGRSSIISKAKRPRIDWMTNPADMFADVFWLEQNNNKKLIEDRQGRRIFPQDSEFRRPVSRQDAKQEHQRPPSQPTKTEEPEEDLQMDTKLPEFKSIKPENERFVEKGASRAKQKLRHVRDAARIHHHTHSGSGKDVRQFLRSRSKSDSSSSESESDHQPRRKRSGTADSHDRGKDILEKQMAEMLEKESKKVDARMGRDMEGQRTMKTFETQKPFLRDELEGSRRGSASHSRSASLANRSKRNSLMNGSSGRASLEVPGSNPRGSLDLDLDTTAPNSPELRARRASNSHIPSISMDLTSPRSRHSSPSRRALSKVRAKIRPNHERSFHSDHFDEEAVVISQTSSKEQQPETPESRRRSVSPTKKIVNRRTGEGTKIRRDRAEDPSGIRGFLKSARNPVNRVSGLLWKKESSPGHGTSSGVSTDESDMEDSRGSHNSEKDTSQDLSGIGKFEDLARTYPPKDRPSYFSDMPTFMSPFEGRGRSTQSRDEEHPSQSSLGLKTDKSRRPESSPSYPHINVQSPVSSPDVGRPIRNRRGSSISNSDSRKGSYPNGVEQADSRLNAVLGFPGKRRNSGLPVTGLTGLEMTHDRRPSMQGKRQWSISDQGVSVNHGPTTKREIARVRALLLSSGIKAKEISRREAAPKDLNQEDQSAYDSVVSLSKDQFVPAAKSQEHVVAAQILASDIQISSRVWQESAETFCNVTIADLLASVEALQSRVAENLTPMTRKAADEADEASKDLVTSQTLNVKRISDKIDKMIRNRRRRFRWVRRGGWVLVEWGLVGVMWYVWFMVMLLRIVMGIGQGIVGSLRWLFFL